MICILIPGGLLLSSAIPRPLAQPLEAEQHASPKSQSLPFLRLRPIDPLKVRLGERLFGDPRLSRDNSRSCSTCHDLGSNGATKVSHDNGLDGSSLPLNTLTVFNATLSFRLGWEGKIRTVESDVKASLQNPQIMGADIAELAEKLDGDPGLRQEFVGRLRQRSRRRECRRCPRKLPANPGDTGQPFRPLADGRRRRLVGSKNRTDIACSNPWVASPVTRA